MDASTSQSTASSSNLLPPYTGSLPQVQVMNLEEYRRDPTMITVIMHREDHTIGNALKHIVSQMPGVEFCGYNVPHPLEDKILVRVQTHAGVKAGDVLLKALHDLGELFDAIGRKFAEAYADFEQEKQQREEEQLEEGEGGERGTTDDEEMASE